MALVPENVPQAGVAGSRGRTPHVAASTAERGGRPKKETIL